MINVVGRNDANSRYNEAQIRESAELRQEIDRFVQLDLYIDAVPDASLGREQASKAVALNREIQERVLNEFSTPAHILFEFDANQPFKDGLPNGRILARHAGMITDPQQFAKMLRHAK